MEHHDSAVTRIGDAVVNTLIAASVAAQLLAVFVAWNGGRASTGLSGIVGFLSMTILPGTVLALVKLILMVMRRSWRGAMVFLLILVLPYLAAGMLRRDAEVAVQQATEQVEAESEEYLAGRDWARAQEVETSRYCNGTHEFNRGCRAAVGAMQHEKFQAGRNWAIQHKPQRPSECEGELNFVAGCHGFFLEQVGDYFDPSKRPTDMPPSGYIVARPMNEEECVREVNAVFDVDHRLHWLKGFDQDDPRAWQARLKICRAMGQRMETAVLAEADGRLQGAVKALKQGADMTDEERQQIEEDHTAVTALSDQPWKSSYLRLYDEYQERLSGRYSDPVVEYPKLSCDEYQRKIDALGELDAQRSLRMREIAKNGGGPGGRSEYEQLNKARIDMLWDLKLYTEGAKAMGCSIATRESGK